MKKKERKETIVLNHDSSKKRIVNDNPSIESSLKKSDQVSDKPVTASMKFTINIY
ncbi:MAG: hypothetical protein K9K63_13875 [Desulfotignum sp.]|nr:hypothetical protein [Desulfotignum sp.]MCF8089158.1 hypothetical protein [Desulfotignum sp.]MCF8138387.1 hypothetical protein [Desulfotignum sp.]